jgi:hypothetical protein
MFVSHFRKSSGLRALLCVGAQKCLIAAAGHSKDNVGKIIFRAVFMLHQRQLPAPHAAPGSARILRRLAASSSPHTPPSGRFNLCITRVA